MTWWQWYLIGFFTPLAILALIIIFLFIIIYLDMKWRRKQEL